MALANAEMYSAGLDGLQSAPTAIMFFASRCQRQYHQDYHPISAD